MSPSTLESATPERELVQRPPSAAPRSGGSGRAGSDSAATGPRWRGWSCWSRLLALALAAPLLTSYNPERQNLSQALRPVSSARTRWGPTTSGATCWPGSSTAAGSRS